MRTNQVESVIKDVVEDASLEADSKSYSSMIQMIISIYNSAPSLPLCLSCACLWTVVIFEFYLKDACSKRCWVDEKNYRQFVNRLISAFKSKAVSLYSFVVTPPPEYTEMQRQSIIDLALHIVQPILNHPVNEVVSVYSL